MNFGTFGAWKIAQIDQNQNLEPLKLQKMPHLTVCILHNLILRKIWVAVKYQNLTKWSPNFTFWKFLEHGVLYTCYDADIYVGD